MGKRKLKDPSDNITQAKKKIKNEDIGSKTQFQIKNFYPSENNVIDSRRVSKRINICKEKAEQRRLEEAIKRSDITKAERARLDKQKAKQREKLKEKKKSEKLKKSESLSSHGSESESDEEAIENIPIHEENKTKVKNNLSDFERKRLENLKANADFFSQLGIFEAKESLTVKSQPSTPATQKKKIKVAKESPPPRRVSQRLSGLPPVPLTERTSYTTIYNKVSPAVRNRKDAGTLNMKDVIYMTTIEGDEEGTKFLEELHNLDNGPEGVTSLSDDEYIKSLDSMTITNGGVAKVVQDRIYSLAVHPSITETLVCAGDKCGKIGLWHVEAANDGGNMNSYEPHSKPVYCMKFVPNDASLLVSSSYDGSIRCCNLEKGVFDELYRTSDKYEEMVMSFDFCDKNTIVACLDDGDLVLVDRRSCEKPTNMTIAEKKLRSVSVHPLERHFLATCQSNGLLQIWDIRNLGAENNKSLCEFSHSRATSSAYFSPVTGSKILSTSLDNHLRIFDSSNPSDIKLKKSISHNNHTGRWLAPFRATWHPQKDDFFAVGSMKFRRRLEIFHSSGKIVKELNGEAFSSISSIVEFHPTRNIIIGGNSSGRVFCFSS